LPEDFRAVINYIRQRAGIVDSFVSRICQPERALGALTAWAENPGKVFRILVEF